MASGTDKFSDLRRRIVFLILAILVYRLGAHIPVPGIDPNQLSSLFKSQEAVFLACLICFQEALYQDLRFSRLVLCLTYLLL